MSQCIISADTLNLPVEFADMFKGQKVELVAKKNTVLIKLINTDETHDEITTNDAQTKQDINELENDPQMIRQRAWNSPDSLRKTRPLHLGKLDWTREDLYDR